MILTMFATRRLQTEELNPIILSEFTQALCPNAAVEFYGSDKQRVQDIWYREKIEMKDSAYTGEVLFRLFFRCSYADFSFERLRTSGVDSVTWQAYLKPAYHGFHTV